MGGGTGGADGRFVLPGIAPGSYTLRVSALGYRDHTRPGVVVPAGGVVALGNISLAAAARQLGEVVVTAPPPLVEEKVDRTVYHAEQDQTTRGGDATDVLRRVPLLSVDLEGNVSLRGSQNIRVLITNKPSTITANSAADGLRQLPADQIKTVEVKSVQNDDLKTDENGGGNQGSGGPPAAARPTKALPPTQRPPLPRRPSQPLPPRRNSDAGPTAANGIGGLKAAQAT